MSTVKLALILVALVVAGCGGTAPTPQIILVTAPPAVTVTVTATPPAPTGTPETFRLSGTLSLDTGVVNYGSAKSCSGTGGYSDIVQGAPVTVRDGAGDVIATGVLGAGVLTDRCLFEFTVARVPAVPFYTVEVSRRGGLTYSHAEMVAMGWFVSFTLGG